MQTRRNPRNGSMEVPGENCVHHVEHILNSFESKAIGLVESGFIQNTKKTTLQK